MSKKILYKSEWADFVSDENGYEYLDENDTVLIIPIKENKIGIRLEFCPSYSTKERYYTLISGTIDSGSSKSTALRELKEEAGIIPNKYTIHRIYDSIGYIKNTNCRNSLYIMHITEYEKITPEGDGSEEEEISKTIWVSPDELSKIVNKPNVDILLMLGFFIIKSLYKKL